MELLGHKDYLRVLMAVERRPLRFTEIQRSLRLNPAQVLRALNFLKKGMWIVGRTRPATKGRIAVEYELGKRGGAFLESFKTFKDELARRERHAGTSDVVELESLTR